ncbi:MAG: YncE family protein [Solirubrobacterales bacterium]|nr:YncE family protein [Solirubrobacterales bacterium]
MDGGCVVDTETGEDARVDLNGVSTAIAMNPAGTRAYVTDQEGNDVSVINTATNTVIGPDIPVGNNPRAVAITPDGTRAYVVNTADNDVSVIDTTTNSLVGPDIPVGSSPQDIAITPDGTRAYVANSGDDDVSVIDLLTGALNGPDIALAPGVQPDGLVITPDGARVYVAEFTQVSVIDTATDSLAGPDIVFGASAFEDIAITPDGTRVYLTSFTGHQVWVLNTTTDTLAGPAIPMGDVAWGVAIAPDGTRAYVSTGIINSQLTVVDVASSLVVGPGIPTNCLGDLALTSVTGPNLTKKPVLARKVVVEPVKGKVKTKCRGEKKFTRLKAADEIPVGCLVDTRKGTVRLTSSKGKKGGTQSAKFWNGLFRVTQKAGKKPYTELKLAGSLGCGKKKRNFGSKWALSSSVPAATDQASVSKKRKKRKRGRKLWGKGKGRFKTKGKYGSASVRGTNWLVEDRWNKSTFFKVKSGVVKVRDFAKKKNVKVKKGRSYVARAPRADRR